MILDITQDACELLDADHLAVKHLFVEYARLAHAAQQDSIGQRTELALQICSELTVHAQIEEEVFYPALRQAAPEAAAQLDDSLREHQAAKELIAQVRAEGTAGPAMDALITELACEIEHHVKEERDLLFPMARTRLDLEEVGARLIERQQALQDPADGP